MLQRTFITVLFILMPLSPFAGEEMITPYGDYCSKCTTYGTCKNTLSPGEAMTAIEQYYREKGYAVGKIQHKGRFIEADIFDGNRLVDRVIFDRKNGRIRSIL